MADRIILLADSASDAGEAQHLIDRFAEAVDIEPEPVEGGYAFELSPEDHAIDVTRTLNDLDPRWTDHLSLGDPANTDRD